MGVMGHGAWGMGHEGTDVIYITSRNTPACTMWFACTSCLHHVARMRFRVCEGHSPTSRSCRAQYEAAAWGLQ